MLELSHEIDYMLWLFGKPNYLKASIDKNRSFGNDIDEYPKGWFKKAKISKEGFDVKLNHFGIKSVKISRLKLNINSCNPNRNLQKVAE